MEGRQMVRRVVVFLIAGLAVAPALPALASPEGVVAAALVSEENYRHILDDMLYTHAGDDRSVFGADHDPARTNIYNLFASYGLNVELEPFDFLEVTLYNVVATKVGVTDPTVEYVIGAHYDSFSFYDEAPGADDDASGVALVLEAARVLSTYPSDYTIRFIAFDAEEVGAGGSLAYVDSHSTDDIRGMISADMVAWNGDGASNVSIFGLAESDPHKSAVGDAVYTYGRTVTPFVSGPSRGGDHYSFELGGFQACLLIEKAGNPNYHTPFDNVDEPNYIDYEFAANNTRSVVGFLVDHAGVHVTMPDADYDDDGDVDQDDFDVFSTCYSGSGNPHDTGCELFDFDGDGDVDCDDSNVFEVLWTGPGDPPVFWPCIILPPEAAGGGCRCLVVMPPEHGLPLALRLAGDPDDPAVWCLGLSEDLYVQDDGRLGTTPVYQTYDQWGTVLICENEIVPVASYRVWCDYGQGGSPIPSAEVTANTTVWGDTVGPYRVGIGWLPPDGSVDIPDVVAILDRFRSLPDAPPLHQVDLIALGLGCRPDRSVDIIDASMAVDGFRGFSYADSTLGNCPGPCE
ncbi:MAG: M20/M25/M40 family metallo-hydrolase [Phycisphaerales bacterium]|nr:MAG: M20/M25/M40 family metallo-hydrolase [Phycisphaerales bacterium]